MWRNFKQFLCMLAVIIFSYGSGAYAQQASDFIRDSELILNANYYGRYRSTSDDNNEIKVNVFSAGVDYRSGYAFGLLGLDASGYANLGRGRGFSELLDYDYSDNRDRSLASLNILLGKFRVHEADYKVDLRAGLTPIDTGTIGTSAGMQSHSYRGVELIVEYLGVELSYAIADKFNPEWKRGPRDMEAVKGDVDFIHTAGLRYEFDVGRDTAFFDGGIGQGWDYRKNAQAAFCYPLREGDSVMTLNGYGFWGKYDTGSTSGFSSARNEYHTAISADLNYYQVAVLSVGYSYTWAPDSEEMNFRLTPWGQSNDRAYMQTTAQLDDFVWHNESALKIGMDFILDRYLENGNLTVGATYFRGWNMDNGYVQTSAWEIDYYAYYELKQSVLEGLNFGVYVGHLRFKNNDFHAKQNRNDIKGIVGYTYKLF